MEAQEIRATLESNGFTEQQASALTLIFSQLATKQDIAALRTEFHQELGQLRSEMHELYGSLRSEMHELYGSLRSEMHALEGRLRAEMHQEFSRLRGEIWWRMSLLLTAQAGLIVSLIKLL